MESARANDPISSPAPKKLKRPDALSRSVGPVVESLEQRQLMSASVPNGPFSLSVSADASSGHASLNWFDSHSNETGYLVERKVAGGTFAVIATLGSTATSYTDASLAANTSYIYSVAAYNSAGESSFAYAGPIAIASTSGTGTSANSRTVPDGPFAPTALPTSATVVNLTWHDSAANETGYAVERQAGSGAYTVIATLGTKATAYTDATANPATQYTYRIYAFNKVGDSSMTGVSVTTPSSNSVTPVTPVTSGVPNAPFALSMSAASSTEIDLKWFDAHSDETGYKVERQTGSGASTVIATLSASAVSYADTSAAAGTTYSYRVYAYNASGVSSAVSGAATTPAGSGGTTTVTSPAGYFPVGVFYQPTYSFSKWSSLGVNLLYGYEKGNGDSMATWDAAAASAGFKEIRQPATTPSSDANVSNLMAWLAPQDEPDLNGVTPATLASQYASLKAADPNIPVITTYAGGSLIGWQGNTTAAQYSQYVAATDWTAADVYPVTGWGMTDLSAVGKVVDKIQSYDSSKKDFAFIETSNQQLSWVPNETGVTPDQLRGEIWDSVIHGASGVVYFPQQIGNGFSFDATPANVAAEMKTQDAKLQSFGAALNSTENPSSAGMSVSGSLETTWRVYGGHTYFFVLNLSANTLTGQALTVKGVSPNTALSVSGENRSVTVNGSTVTDSFAPYALHIYVA